MKIQKKILVILIIILTFINTITCINPVIANTPNNQQPTNSTNQEFPVPESPEPPKPNFTIYSEGAVLLDSNTGAILYGKNENKKLYPASTTKIITAILAIENCKLTDKITASYNAVMSIPAGYSNAAIQPGETLTVQELLDMFLIQSANEIGYIFAEHISGSTESFATLMNQKASSLGCKNTHFTNPSGIHDPEHYSTAYDMALIARYCMKNETFRSVVSKTSCTISATDKYEQRHFKNTNDLINPSSKYYYKYAIGTKTGYTSQAKRCLIATSLKDNLELITVTLGAESSIPDRRYEDTTNLFEYGYSNYKIQKIATKGSTAKEVTVEHATKDTKNLSLLLKDDITGIVPASLDLSDLNPSIELNNSISAPIEEGAILGKITYNIGNFKYSTDLISSHAVEKFDVTTMLWQILLALVVLFILAKLLLIKRSSNNKNSNNKKSNNRNLKNQKSKNKKSGTKKRRNYQSKKSSDSIYKFN